MLRPLVLALVIATTATAQDAVTVALWVNDVTIDAAQLTKAISSSDKLTRATAARVATVRGIEAVLPALREAVAGEQDAEAAREQVRALALIGTADDVGLAAKQLARFPASIDSDFAEAVARRGAPASTTLYVTHLPALRHPAPAVTHSLWGRSALASTTAAQLLGANDFRGFAATLDAMAEANLPLDPGVASTALASESQEVREKVVWFLVSSGPADFQAGPDPQVMSPGEAFGREVLRRKGGAEMKTRPEWLAWLRSDEGRARVPAGKPVQRFLTLDEQNAFRGEKPTDAHLDPSPKEAVHQSGFSLPIIFPAGLGDAVVKQLRCKSGWVGVVQPAVDRAGRVQSVDTSKLNGAPECRRAAETLARLSLADPALITAPLTDYIQMVKVPGDGCFDEGAPEGGTGELRRIGGSVKAPQIVKRVDPFFPESARRAIKGSRSVVAEAIITKTGCVRDLRLLSQSPFPELNAAALQALAKWKFKPGTLDGQPVDVIFTVTVNFRNN
jgi:TonB family protein